VRWRRKPRTVNEELLRAEPREAEGEAAAALAGRENARARRLRRTAWVGAALVLGLKWVVELLPTWLQLFADAARSMRASLVVGLAGCIAVTVLVATGDVDRAALGLAWPLLALVWVAYRLRAANRAPAERLR
jgi:hypothetical protein